MHFPYVALAIKSNANKNVHATQMILPKLHFVQGTVNQQEQLERAVVTQNRGVCSFVLGTYPQSGSAPPPPARVVSTIASVASPIATGWWSRALGLTVSD